MQNEFYAPTYLENTYPEIASNIEKAIFENYGDNGWDLFTSFKNVEEVENFIENNYSW